MRCFLVNDRHPAGDPSAFFSGFHYLLRSRNFKQADALGIIADRQLNVRLDAFAISSIATS